MFVLVQELGFTGGGSCLILTLKEVQSDKRNKEKDGSEAGWQWVGVPGTSDKATAPTFGFRTAHPTLQTASSRGKCDGLI